MTYTYFIRNQPMPARSDLTTAQLSEYLTSNFGPEINADNVRSACDHFGVTYATATKRLRDFYVKRGTWNLTCLLYTSDAADE